MNTLDYLSTLANNAHFNNIITQGGDATLIQALATGDQEKIKQHLSQHPLANEIEVVRL